MLCYLGGEKANVWKSPKKYNRWMRSRLEERVACCIETVKEPRPFSRVDGLVARVGVKKALFASVAILGQLIRDPGAPESYPILIFLPGAATYCLEQQASQCQSPAEEQRLFSTALVAMSLA